MKDISTPSFRQEAQFTNAGSGFKYLGLEPGFAVCELCDLWEIT